MKDDSIYFGSEFEVYVQYSEAVKRNFDDTLRFISVPEDDVISNEPEADDSIESDLDMVTVDDVTISSN